MRTRSKKRWKIEMKCKIEEGKDWGGKNPSSLPPEKLGKWSKWKKENERGTQFQAHTFRQWRERWKEKSECVSEGERQGMSCMSYLPSFRGMSSLSGIWVQPDWLMYCCTLSFLGTARRIWDSPVDIPLFTFVVRLLSLLFFPVASMLSCLIKAKPPNKQSCCI